MKKISFFFYSLFSVIVAWAQPAEERVVAAIDSFALDRPQEKAYLQTDKSTYLSGETIWYKAYVTLGEKPTILSTVLYVDITDQSGKVMDKQMLQLTAGTAKGGITIKKEWQGGDYFARCYTLWMQNFPAFIDRKKIRLVNYNDAKKTTTAALSKNITVSFFPEGGNLVSGLKSIVAFKAVDDYGQPVTIAGDIVNSKNKKTASFTTLHDGMGSFELQPAAGETYTAVIAGQQKNIPLPAIRPEGITLTIDNTNANKAFVKVERSTTNSAAYNNLLLIAQSNYQVVSISKLNIDEGLDAAAINKKNLQPGIMQVTVLTADGKPLAERLVFIANHTIDNDKLVAGTIDTDKRKKNELNLDVTGFSHLSAAVSVTNADAEPALAQSSILSSLLLASDIKGQVNEPTYYFANKDPQTLQALDLLMMVNGWRRFNLNELMTGKLPPLHYPFETSMSISGKVLHANGKAPLGSGKINLIVKGSDSTSILSEARTDENGVFVVDKLNFRQDATVYYQGTNSNRENAIVTVKLNDAYIDTLKNTGAAGQSLAPGYVPISPFNEQAMKKQQQDDPSFGKTLETVTVKGRRLSVADSLNNVYASPYFYNSDQTVAVDDNVNAFDIWQFLQRSTPGLKVNRTDTGIQVNFSRYDGLNFFSQEAGNGVQLFLNEVPVAADVVDAVNPSDIALVKIYKGATAIALGADRGAIALYTVKGKSTRDWRDKGFDYFKRTGYAVEKEFYNMDYNRVNSSQVASDIRPTLYWEPEVKVINGKAVIAFYTDDVAKKFHVTVEGVDGNGKLLHVEKIVP